MLWDLYLLYILWSQNIQRVKLCRLRIYVFLFGKIIQIFLFTLNDKFTLNEISTSTAMLIVSSIALYVGIALKKKINEKVYQKIIKELLFTLATVLIIQVSV